MHNLRIICTVVQKGDVHCIVHCMYITHSVCTQFSMYKVCNVNTVCTQYTMYNIQYTSIQAAVAPSRGIVRGALVLLHLCRAAAARLLYKYS